MDCPKCKTEISDKDPKCPKCGFDALSMDDQMGTCPIPHGHVNDFAGVLSKEDVEKLKTLLNDYKQKTGNDVAVVTQNSTEPLTPAQYVFWLYNEWGIGGKSHKGVMILLALKERRIESEVGFGLEHILTDERSGDILDKVVVPYLKDGKYGEGLLQGAKTIVEALG